MIYRCISMYYYYYYTYILLLPVPKARWKCCVKLRMTPSLRTGLILLNPIASEHPLGPVKTHLKAKTSNALIWAKVFWFFFGSANALCAKTGGSNMDIRLSKLDCMEISSVNGLSCITSENQHVSPLLWCRTEKIWGKRTFNPKSTGMWKSKPSEDTW